MPNIASYSLMSERLFQQSRPFQRLWKRFILFNFTTLETFNYREKCNSSLESVKRIETFQKEKIYTSFLNVAFFFIEWLIMISTEIRCKSKIFFVHNFARLRFFFILLFITAVNFCSWKDKILWQLLNKI